MSRRIVLHIGEPKCGTTFLQGIVWSNRAALARAGVTLPGIHPQDHYRAAQDLRGVAAKPDDPRGSWAGEWDVLAADARSASGTVLISHEMLAGVTRERADRAMDSLGLGDPGVEIDVVITVRDFASLLPAEWQETVKHRNRTPYRAWLRQIIDAPVKRGRAAWFWAAHDTMDVLDRWGHRLPPERVHVIPVPPRSAGPNLLWERFARVLEVPADAVDTSATRPNESLGLVEVEMLRRLNRAVNRKLPVWFYQERVKELIAHDTLAARPDKLKLRLPRARESWAIARSDQLIADLQQSRYDVVGELEELRSRPAVERPPRLRDVDDKQLLAAAIDALSAVLVDEYRGMQAGTGPVAGASSPWRAAKRTVRRLTARHESVRRGRVVAWRVAEQVRKRRARR